MGFKFLVIVVGAVDWWIGRKNIDLAKIIHVDNLCMVCMTFKHYPQNEVLLILSH